MSTLEERLHSNRMSRLYRSGERLPGVMFRHNSKVMATMHDGSTFPGWIVAVDPSGDEPIYLIEREDREPDIEVQESALELITDPHDN